MSDKKIGEVVDWILLKRVIGFSKPYKKQMIFASFAAILLSILSPLRPLVINFTVDNHIMKHDHNGLINMVIILFLLLILEGVFQFFYMYFSTWIGQHVIKDLRNILFKHIISLRMTYFDNTPIGTIVTRCVSDIETIADIFSQGLLVILAELLKLFVIISIMFYVDWRLTLVSMITIPFLLIATNWFKKNIKSAFQNVREQVSELNTFVQEHIVGMSIIQIFNKEKSEYKIFKKINHLHMQAHLNSIFYYAVFFPIVEILSATSIALVVWYGAESFISEKNVTAGELIAFILYIHMMFRPIRQLADRFNILQMGIVGSQRVFKLFDNKDFIENKGKERINHTDIDIEFDNVHFSYKENIQVLSGISFKIKYGNFLAIVGDTGAGKTSIINILNRFYDIQKGQIKIGDIPIKQIELSNLRSKIALVQQEVFLFSESIYQNIILFSEEITKERVIRSAKEIGVHDFIMSLPNNYDYIVGERGLSLSSGQRQLIAFLRVYIRDPKILILDEATSSIDTETEELLQNALKKLSKNRTTIVIAHRLSTIIHADNILFLKNGTIVEEGDHKNLLLKKGLYSNMYTSQLDN